MTAQNSTSNISKGAFHNFLPYYLNKVKYLRPQLIMSIIFSVLSYPVFMLFIDIACPMERECYRLMGLATTITPDQSAQFQAAQDRLDLLYSFFVTELIIGVLSLVGLFIFTFVTTLRSFRYLYNKSVVDMDMSLPIDHNTRFFGDLAAVFTVNILPHLCSILLGQILLLFSDLMVFDSTGQTQKIVEAIMGPMAFTGLFMCIMEIAITLLMLSFCGRFAESCIYSFLINFAIPVIHLMTLNLVESGVYGAVLYPSALSVFWGSAYPITASSPLGMVVMTLYSMISTSCEGTISDVAPIFRPEYGIPALLVTLACFAGAYFLIKYRRAERVGMPYVYKGMGLVIPGIVIFAITVPVSYFVSISLRGQEDTMEYSRLTANSVPGLVIGTLIGTFILYIIMELISGRNFRKFGISVAKWAGTLAACALICFGLNMSNGFGAAYYIPDPARVASAGVSYTNWNIPGDEFRQSALTKNTFHITALDGDTEMLQLINELHEEVPKNNGDWVDDGYIVEFYYVMKDGTQLERRYSLSEELFQDFRSKMVTPEGWYSRQFTADEMKLRRNGYHVDYVFSDRSIEDASDEIFDVIKADCQKVNIDFIENEPKWKHVEICINLLKKNSSNMSDSIWINVYDWMDNTISYLKSIGIDVTSQFTGNGYKTAFIVKNASSLNYAEMFGQSEGYTFNEYQRLRFDVPDMSPNDDDYGLQFTYGRLEPSDTELEKLISVSGSFDYSGNVDKYMIILFKFDNLQEYISDDFDALTFAVPTEYSDLAESILQRCMVQEYHSSIPENGIESTYA